MIKSTKFLTILASALLLLAACGEKDQASSNEETASTQEVAAENSTASKEKATENEQADTSNEQATTTEALDDKDSTTEATTSKENTATEKSTTEDASTSKTADEATSEQETTEKSSTTINPVHKDFLQNQLKTAKNGMTEGVPFESGESVFEDITKAWGEPTTKFSNDTNYIEYAKNGKVQYAFAIGRGDRVYDVRTFVAPDNSFTLSDITFDEIIAVAGNPTSVKTSGNDKILSYSTGKNILKFVGPASTNKLDHISIFNQASSEPMGGRN